MSKKYDMDDIDPDDPAYEMLGSKYSHLVGKDSGRHRPRNRDDGDLPGGGADDKKHRKHHRGDRHD